MTRELLAPAGSMSALHAAVRGGANAVYLGLEQFNARRGAENFTLETLREACDYAHLRGVKIYVTLNIAVLPHEVGAALECARQAWRAGADAFIVQDIGLAAELRRILPQARLHISTQMNTHNAAGIRAAAALGAARVTLARELSLPEIAELTALASELGLETECFIHGALCVCYSGQCFMSSLIGGRSANRGMCAQACRLPYELYNKATNRALPADGEHLLSPQDLCAAPLLPELFAAGVTSFKIEGRMKSAEYVASVTGVYRELFDHVAAGAKGAQAAPNAMQKQELAEAFTRGFTTAYLEGKRDNSIMSYKRPNNRGVNIGRVTSVNRNQVVISSNVDINVGDVLEFWTGTGHVVHTVNKIEPDTKSRGYVLPVGIESKSVRVGDRVFRVRNAENAFDDNALEPRVHIVGRVEAYVGEPLRITFWRAGDEPEEGFPLGCAEGPVLEQARTKAVTADEIREHVDRMGNDPFVLVTLYEELEANVGMGFSTIHHVRAEALDALQDALLAPYHDRKLNKTPERELLAADYPNRPTVAAWVTNPTCAHTAKRNGAQVLYVPTYNYKRGCAQVAGQLSQTVEQTTYPKQCVPAIPVVEHDAVSPAREAVLGIDPWANTDAAKVVFVDSLGAIQRAIELEIPFEVGPHVPVTNTLTLQWLAKRGAARVWLSPELNLKQITALAQDTPVELGLTVIGTQELMTMEHCPLMSQGPCAQNCGECARRKSPHYLHDRKGFDFPVITDACGRGHVYNSVQLDVVNAIPDLLAAHVTAFMVDTTLMNGEETAQALARVSRAVKLALEHGDALSKVNGATSGHLYRGVS